MSNAALLGVLSSSLSEVFGLFPSGLFSGMFFFAAKIILSVQSSISTDTPRPGRQHLTPPQHRARGLPSFEPLCSRCWLAVDGRSSWVPSRSAAQNKKARVLQLSLQPSRPPGKIPSSSPFKSQGRSAHPQALPTQVCAHTSCRAVSESYQLSPGVTCSLN